MDNKIISNALLEMADSLESKIKKISIGINSIGTEHGPEMVIEGARAAMMKNPSINPVVIATEQIEGLETIVAKDEENAASLMEEALDSGRISACITQHYSFPIGVSTVGRVIAPANGRSIYIATTTGTSAIDRVEAMTRNAVAGIIAAKACGVKKPSVGILNVEGARSVEKKLMELKSRGYDIQFGASQRADGGAVLRGNDLVTGAVDVVVCDSLTGNVLMKMFSSLNSGGTVEVLGDGYGPGVGKDYERKIFILSRASGARVAEGAFNYAFQVSSGKIQEIAKKEYKKLEEIKWEEVLAVEKKTASSEKSEVKMPDKCVVTAAIAGIDILELEDAVQALWEAGIYAESGMGCTGPIVLVSDETHKKAIEILQTKGFVASEKKDC